VEADPSMLPLSPEEITRLRLLYDEI